MKKPLTNVQYGNMIESLTGFHRIEKKHECMTYKRVCERFDVFSSYFYIRAHLHCDARAQVLTTNDIGSGCDALTASLSIRWQYVRQRQCSDPGPK